MDDASGSPKRKANHLAGQTSPYLLQHLYNPVDWYAWSDQALNKARREDKPIFLSIGYAACHWCHVMERESFENPEIAAILNRDFVPIKVDREERPDLDEIYMHAVQLMVGQGGWPLNMFLTPALEPFMGGTYFPPEDRYGRVGFPAVLARIGQVWKESRDDINRSAAEMTQRLRQIGTAGIDGSSSSPIGQAELAGAAAEFTARFDARWGGFGPAPKFPADGGLALLLSESDRTKECAPAEIVTRSLDRMASGGMYDQIGGGFARYSVDERWLVPHFEKMLYNQALLVPVYLNAWRVTGSPLYRRVVEETLDFVRNEMTDREGGFYASLDADSEGVEGKFYVWTQAEIEDVLGPDDGRFFGGVYGVTPEGNFESHNVLNLLGGTLAEQAAASGTDEQSLVERLAPLKKRLMDRRADRVRPGTDDKILTSWNGLMIGAYAQAFQALGRKEDLAAAVGAAEFVLARLRRDGRLFVSYRDGRAHLNGYLDDYAFLARGLLDLYEAGFETRYLVESGALAETVLRHFEDADHGGFFFISDDHETLLSRNRSLHDGALPSGAGVAVELLLRLASHLDRPDFREAAERTLSAYRPLVARAPSAYAALLTAATRTVNPPVEVGIRGELDDPATAALLATVRRPYRGAPAIQVAADGADPGPRAILREKSSTEGRATAYVCRDYACQAPTDDPQELARQLGDA